MSAAADTSRAREWLQPHSCACTCQQSSSAALLITASNAPSMISPHTVYLHGVHLMVKEEKKIVASSPTSSADPGVDKGLAAHGSLG